MSKSHDTNKNSLISIIIPTLNEAETIESLLEYLTQFIPDSEIIIADGGSTDGTLNHIISNIKIVHSPPGRAIQMNQGAAVANGDILWFLHADCFPQAESYSAIQKVMKNNEIVGGGFEYALDENGLVYRVSEFFSNRKNRILKLLYGDMGIFVRKDIFATMGGFAEIPLMEDMDFSKRLKKRGKIEILPFRLKTSARRWVEEGPIKNIVRNWALQILWLLGTSPSTLAKWYKFSKSQK